MLSQTVKDMYHDVYDLQWRDEAASEQMNVEQLFE